MMDIIKNMGFWEMFYDLVITGWALGIFWALKSISKKLDRIKENTKMAYSSTKSETRINSYGNAVEDTSITFNREKHEPTRDEFTSIFVKYNKWSNFISTLTILGLLGTVVGLMPGLLAVKSSNLDTLYSSLSTALTSTAIGLSTTLLLKIYVFAGPNAKLNEIELLFDRIDRRYDIAISNNNIIK